MRKAAAIILGTFGFFLAAGSCGGIECDTMGWEEGILMITLGLTIMWGAAVWGRLSR